jgi:hypothetical protein
LAESSSVVVFLVKEIGRRPYLLDMAHAINPTARVSTMPTVTIPKQRTLVVVRVTSEETGEFLAPVSSTVAVKARNTAESVAKTVRPTRWRAA